jgi:hypothetical protein
MQKAVDVAMDLHENHGLSMDEAADIAAVILFEQKTKKQERLVEQIENNLSLWRLSESLRTG